MVGILVGIGFVGMVLAPCAVAIYSKLGSSSERLAEIAETKAPQAEPVFVPLPPTELTVKSESARGVSPLSTSPVPVRVPSLRRVAEMAAREAQRAQAVAAQAHLEALKEASREAGKRAQAAEKLAEAAERELVRATQASLQAEAAKERARAAQKGGNEGDYLPHDHPSLDFPRSRVPHRRVA